MDNKTWIKPNRRGRMKGYDVFIDSETLQRCGFSPSDKLKFRRYPCKNGRIILKPKVVE